MHRHFGCLAHWLGLLQRRSGSIATVFLDTEFTGLARQIFKELFANKEFCTLLKAEKLTSVPQPLVDLLPRGGLGR
jgi:hypothetical protein